MCDVTAPCVKEVVEEEKLGDVDTSADDENNNKEPHQKQLSKSQLARIERNRQRALLLRQSRLAKQQANGSDAKMTVGCKRVVDSGAGFLVEENSDRKEKKMKVVEEAPPSSLFATAGDDDMYVCGDCDRIFVESWLLTNFSLHVCDACRDNEVKHALVTKTEAKDSYLLTDVDLLKREPPLKFIIRKNPRNAHWGDMKLFLRLQIEQRALEVWKTPEAIEEEKDERERKRELAKRKKFQKKMTQLRQEVRSSLYTVKSRAHVHEYGDEVQLDEDTWKKSCLTCQHSVTFEKM